MNALAAVRLARAGLMLKYPYFASALARMPVIMSDRLPFPTLAVDKHWRLYVHPEVADWEPYMVRMALYHELLHLVVGHPDRMEWVSHQHGTRLANYAADMEVNWRLQEEGWAVPECAITCESHGLPGGLLAEDYARLLAESVPPCRPGGESGAPGSGDDKGSQGPLSPDASGSGSSGVWQPWEETDDPGQEPPGVSPEEADALRRVIARSISDAIQSGAPIGSPSMLPGAIPGHLQQWAEATVQPETADPLAVLSAILGAAIGRKGGRRSTWLRPSRRATCSPLPLQGRRSVAPAVAVVLDTSGSMEEQIAEGLGLVTRLAQSMGCYVTVLCVDSEVQAVQRAVSGTQVTVAGGGGTNMAVGIQAAAKLTPKPEVIIVFTDGWTIAWPEARPPVTAVVIALTDPAQKENVPSWAKVVIMHRREKW